jgi:hypothetical protein
MLVGRHGTSKICFISELQTGRSMCAVAMPHKISSFWKKLESKCIDHPNLLLSEIPSRFVLAHAQNSTGYRFFHWSVFVSSLMPLQLCPQDHQTL